jgi:hypothetical protein
MRRYGIDAVDQIDLSGSALADGSALTSAAACSFIAVETRGNA